MIWPQSWRSFPSASAKWYSTARSGSSRRTPPSSARWFCTTRRAYGSTPFSAATATSSASASAPTSQDASVLHADPGIPLTLGKNVSVGHQAMLHGCSIGDGTLVGIGAIIMNHAVIGSRCLIAAGTLIPEGKTYPDGVLVLGSPGKVVRELKPEEKEGLLEIADGYVRRSKLYREKLKPQGR